MNWLSRRWGAPQLMIAGAMIILFTFILAAVALGPVLDLALGILLGLAGWTDFVVRWAFTDFS